MFFPNAAGRGRTRWHHAACLQQLCNHPCTCAMGYRSQVLHSQDTWAPSGSAPVYLIVKVLDIRRPIVQGAPLNAQDAVDFVSVHVLRAKPWPRTLRLRHSVCATPAASQSVHASPSVQPGCKGADALCTAGSCDLVADQPSARRLRGLTWC